MTPYIDYSGKKISIVAYEMGEDCLIIKFNNSDEETYTVKMDGKMVIKQMTNYALDNKGLNEFIERYKGVLKHTVPR